MSDLRTRLNGLAENLWWSWHPEVASLFRSIDAQRWRAVNHNPIAFLRHLDDETVAARATDPRILAKTSYAERRLREYLERQDHWASHQAAGLATAPVAYFSAEFCIHESLPIYSGGLGVLAGDHLKSCSDLGVPVYGVSLMYRNGYFVQQVGAAGEQIEIYRGLDTEDVPLERARDAQGAPLSVRVPSGKGELEIDVWQARVGRCPLLLLDVRDWADGHLPDAMRLYGGDRSTRIIQELVLGVGGYRALLALGIRPGVLHLNEGHCAFAPLEAIAAHMESSGVSFRQAAAEIVESVVFTTHTPVDAGHDRFAPALVGEYLEPLRQRLQISAEELLAFGRIRPDDADEPFCMTVLALKVARLCNGVSALHGSMSRRMWQSLWPRRRSVDVPIGHITNGVHVDTWLGAELAQLYSDCLGSDWRENIPDPQLWRRIDRLDEVDLWSLKLALKRNLLDFVQRRSQARAERLGRSDPLPGLRLDALTIGFGRRVAVYKRLLLFFADLDWAVRVLTDPRRPVQLLVSGKSHPADEPGKAILRRLMEISDLPELRDHVVFIENYDSNVSRHMLEGCDLWMNAPRRPLEACGTSGMKAVFNATLNCSTLDGWWDEAYDTRNGFAFGDGRIHADAARQDAEDARSLRDVIEHQVVPLFYERDAQNVPVRWLRTVKRALETLGWRYNSDRMVVDYVRNMYLPASNKLSAHL